jgi:hypothetical protein
MRAGRTTECRAELHDGLGMAGVLPMTLLPLLDQAMNLLSTGEAERGMVCVRATASAQRLETTIDAQGHCFAGQRPSPNVAALRDRLFALYAADAETSVSRMSCQAAKAVLAIPLDMGSQHTHTSD